jgi:hypothetical protein
MGFIYQSACASYVNGFTECQRPACYSARRISMVLVGMLVARPRPLRLTAGSGDSAGLGTSSAAQWLS